MGRMLNLAKVFVKLFCHEFAKNVQGWRLISPANNKGRTDRHRACPPGGLPKANNPENTPVGDGYSRTFAGIFKLRPTNQRGDRQTETLDVFMRPAWPSPPFFQMAERVPWAWERGGCSIAGNPAYIVSWAQIIAPKGGSVLLNCAPGVAGKQGALSNPCRPPGWAEE